MPFNPKTLLSELEQTGHSLPAVLNLLGLFDFPRLYAVLQPPPAESLRGIYKGSFVGPGWLRWLAGPLLALTGLGGWWGKDFDDQGNAINLVMRQERIERRFPMLLVEESSRIDQQSGFSLHYAHDNPIPWPWIVDELRSLQPGILLGMSMLRLPLMHWLALPFILESQAQIE